MEGMIGGNFNTFGEQASDVFFKNRKSVTEDDNGRDNVGSTRLI